MTGRLAHRSEQFGLLAIVAVCFAIFEFHHQMFLLPGTLDGGWIEGELAATLDGTYAAPFQYRVLAPWIIEAFRDLGLTTYGAVGALDALSIAGGATIGIVAFRRRGMGWALPAGAAWLAMLGIGAAFWPKFETYPSFAVVSAMVLLLVDDRLPRWPLVPLAVLQALLRTDHLLALAVGFWLLGRAGGRRADRVAAIGLASAGVVGTVGMKLAYPDAEYPEHFPLLQLGENLTGHPLAVVFVLVAVPVFPLVVGGRRLLSTSRGRLGFAFLAPHLAQVAMTFFVGRLNEIRIELPFVWSTAMGAVLLWQELADGDAADDRSEVTVTAVG